MDTVTQIALGAAVGEAALGKKAGNTAVYWGAGLGVLPDLDILITPFVSEVQALILHRALTHSLLFVVAVSPLLGRFISRLHKQLKIDWKTWSGTVLLVLLTHVLLDCLTTYGTQIFQPFSRYSVSLSTIFVIDPIYTIPLALGVILALRKPPLARVRRTFNYTGLGLSCAYLVLTAGFKLHSESVFKNALGAEQIQYERIKTIPSPFNSILWVGLAEENDTIYVGLYSLLDEDDQIDFRPVPKNSRLLSGLRSEREVQQLIWFSNGYYSVDRSEEGLLFHDLRFGRSDMWLSKNSSYVFTWLLIPDSTRSDITGVRHRPDRNISGEMLGRFVRRVFGTSSER